MVLILKRQHLHQGGGVNEKEAVWTLRGGDSIDEEVVVRQGQDRQCGHIGIIVIIMAWIEGGVSEEKVSSLM